MDISDVSVFSRDVAVAQRLLATIDDELSAVTSGCRTQEDTARSLRKIEQIIDQRLAGFHRHPLLGPVISEMKTQYYNLIIDQQRPTQSAGLRLRPVLKNRPFSVLVKGLFSKT